MEERKWSYRGDSYFLLIKLYIVCPPQAGRVTVTSNPGFPITPSLHGDCYPKKRSTMLPAGRNNPACGKISHDEKFFNLPLLF